MSNIWIHTYKVIHKEETSQYGVEIKSEFAFGCDAINHNCIQVLKICGWYWCWSWFHTHCGSVVASNAFFYIFQLKWEIHNKHQYRYGSMETLGAHIHTHSSYVQLHIYLSVGKNETTERHCNENVDDVELLPLMPPLLLQTLCLCSLCLPCIHFCAHKHFIRAVTFPHHRYWFAFLQMKWE